MELFKLLGTIAISGVDAANDQIGKVSSNAGKLGNTLSKIGNKASDFGGKLTKRLSAPLTALGTLAVKSAADVKAANSQYEQTFGELQDTATNAINKVADSSGILETRLKGVGTSIYAFAKASGAESAEAMALMEEALQATADAAAYYDRSLDDTSESLMSFLKGNFSNDAALGVSATEFTRNAKAAELFGKKYNDLTEIQKQQTLLKMVTDAQKLSGAMGQASREADGFENVMGNLKESSKLLAAEFGEVLLPHVVNLIQGLTGLLQPFSNLDEGTKKIILTLGGVAVAVGPVLTITGKIVSGIGEIIRIGGILKGGIGNLIPMVSGIAGLGSKLLGGIGSLATKIGSALIPALTAIGPVGWAIIGAITALVVAGVALYKNWDEVSQWASKTWGAIKEVVGKALEGIGNLLSGVFDFIKNNWQGLLLMIANPFLGAFKLVYDNCEPFRNFINELLAWIKDAISNAWTWIKDTVASIITGIITAIATYVPKLFEAGVNLIKGLFDGIVSLISNIPELIRSIFDAIVGGIKALFGIHSPSTVMMEIGKWIMEGLFEGIRSLVDAISEIWEYLKGITVAAFSGIKDAVTSAWEGIKSGISDGVEAIKNLFSNMVDAAVVFKDNLVSGLADLKEKAVAKFQELKDSASQKVSELKETIVSKATELKDKASAAFSGIADKAVEGFNNLREKGSSAIEGLGSAFTNIFSSMWNTVVEKASAFAEKFSQPFENAKDKVRDIVSSIKEFFNFNWELPKIKLPHFNISYDTGGLLGGLATKIGLPGIPKFDVEWYKDGGIMTDPTAFGFNPYSGKVMAGGEAGPEAIAPISTLQSYVQEAVSESNYQLYQALNQILSLLTQYFPQLANKQLVLDTGALVGELAEPMNEELGKITYMRGRWN